MCHPIISRPCIVMITSQPTHVHQVTRYSLHLSDPEATVLSGGHLILVYLILIFAYGIVLTVLWGEVIYLKWPR